MDVFRSSPFYDNSCNPSYTSPSFLLVQKTTERPKLMASATSTLSKPISADDDASFWTMIERINVNALSASEMKKFMEAMRLEHAAMANAVNLQDLDYMASKL